MQPGNEAAGGWFTAHCDGGSRGNPGPAGYGAVIEDPEGEVVARLSEYLGRQTNNYAEYKGLLAVLEWALANGVRRLRVVSDSELMVRQMKGRYKVKNPGLRPLWEEAQRLARASWKGLRCGTRCAAETKRRTGWRMRRWIKAGNKPASGRVAREPWQGTKELGSSEQGLGTEIRRRVKDGVSRDTKERQGGYRSGGSRDSGARGSRRAGDRR